jgi:Skp family chaperone for outer membrane proteins
MTVTQTLKSTLENARTQIEGFEKEVNKTVAKLEKRAKAGLEDVREQVNDVPQQLRGAWDSVVGRLRSALAFATREELDTVAHRVDDLAKKVEKLIRGEKIRSSATGTKPTAPKKS